MNFRKSLAAILGVFAASLLLFVYVGVSHAATFQVGATVQVTASGGLSIRSTPGGATVVGAAPYHATGTIIGGPATTTANSYIWWQINWPTLNVSGWSVQSYLAVLSGSTSTATTTTSTASFNFSLSNGGNVTLVRGSSATQSISATLTGGTTKSVTFSAAGLPAGVLSGFSPSSCNPTCPTTMSLSASASTATGTYPITITGTAGTSTKTTSFSLTIASAGGGGTGFDFSLSNGGNASVAQGSQVTESISAALVSGTAQSVTFGIAGLPSGALYAFSPTSCNPVCSTTLTIQAGASTPVGSYPITVSGTNGTITRTTPFTLTVTTPGTGSTFNFALSSGGTVSVAQGSQANQSITATILSGTSQAVSFGIVGLPSGALSGFSPASCNPTCPTTLTIQAGASTPVGSYPVTVSGISGGIIHTTSFTLVVTTGGGQTTSTPGTLTVLSPLGGERWGLGSTQLVQWGGQNVPAGSLISISIVNALNPSTIIQSLGGGLVNDGSESVAIPIDIAAGSYRIQVVASAPDGTEIVANSNTISILASSITITSPASAQQWTLATPQTVSWTNNYVSSSSRVTITLVHSADLSVEATLATDVPNGGSVQIQVPVVATGTYKVQVTANDQSGLSITGTSAAITVKAPSARIITPTTGTKWYYKNTQTVVWSATGTPADALVNIDLVLSDTARTLSDNLTPQQVSNSGSADITVPIPSAPATSYRVKITMTYQNETLLTAESNTFSVTQAPLTFGSPILGTKWFFGTNQVVTWSATNTPSDALVTLTLLDSTLNSVGDLTTSGPVQNSGSANVIVPLIPAGNYKLRLTMTESDETILSTMSVSFAIAQAPVRFVSPVATTTWVMQRNQTTIWATTSTFPDSTTVNITLVDTDAGQTEVQPLVTGAPNNGSASFMLPVVPLTDPGLMPKKYRVRLQVLYNEETILATTSAQFLVAAPTLPIFSPAGGENWARGATQTIQWDSSAIPANSLLSISIWNATNQEWENMASDLSNSGSANAIIPSDVPLGTSTIQLAAKLNDDPLALTTSKAFNVTPPIIQVSSPTSTDIWNFGSTQHVRWTNSNVPANASIAVSLLANGLADPVQTWSSDQNDGFLDITIPGIGTPGISTSTTFAVQVQATHPDGQVTIGTSAYFRLAPVPITLTIPNNKWYVSQTRHIGWTTAGLPSSTLITMDLVNGVTSNAVSVGADLPNTGGYDFLVPSDANAGDYTLELTASNDDGILGTASMGPVSIILPSFTFNTPSGGEIWKPGSQQSITWQSNYVPTTALVRFSLVDASTLEPIATAVPLATDVPNSGSYTLSVPMVSQDGVDPLNAFPPVNYRLQIATDYPDGRGSVSTSNVITYAQPNMNISAPQAGVTWIIGSAQTISWGLDPQVTAPTKVSVILVPTADDSYEQQLSDTPIQNTGSFSLGVVPDVAPGSYYIRLEEFLNDDRIGVIRSGVFQVSDCSSCATTGNISLASERLNKTSQARAKMKMHLTADNLSSVKKVQYSLNGTTFSKGRNYPFNKKFKTKQSSVDIKAKIIFKNGQTRTVTCAGVVTSGASTVSCQ